MEIHLSINGRLEEYSLNERRMYVFLTIPSFLTGPEASALLSQITNLDVLERDSLVEIHLNDDFVVGMRNMREVFERDSAAMIMSIEKIDKLTGRPRGNLHRLLHWVTR